MSSYIFSHSIIEFPIFIKYKSKKNWFLLAEGIRKNLETGVWDVRLLQDFSEFPWMRKSLKEGIRFSVSNNHLIVIKLKRAFLCSRICVFINGHKIKRRHFSQHKLSY